MKYDSKVRSKDKNKIHMNKVLAELTENCSVSTDKINALVLDTEKLLTTKSLMKAGVKKENITICNPFIFDKIKKIHNNVKNVLVGDYIYSLTSFSMNLDLVLLDYCSTLNGNSEISPEQDIKTLFDKRILASESLLAVTISLRNKHKKYRTSDINILDSVITRSAFKNEYVAVKIPEGYNYNGMGVVFYRIHDAKDYD